MGRAKRKRKAKLRQKRFKKQMQGKKVPFTLSNSPKKLKGIKNSYQYKVNVHHCVFVDARFDSVRYRSGHITNSTFKNAKITNTDFICVNLKKNRFRNTHFNNCTFYGCNMEDSDFRDATFNNVYFISCNLKNIQNFTVTDKIFVIKKYPDLHMSLKLEKILYKMSLNSKLEKFNILTINSKKINYWMMELLLSKYSEQELIAFFTKLLKSNKTWFYTIHDYVKALQNYYKR